MEFMEILGLGGLGGFVGGLLVGRWWGRIVLTRSTQVLVDQIVFHYDDAVRTLSRELTEKKVGVDVDVDGIHNDVVRLIRRFTTKPGGE